MSSRAHPSGWLRGPQHPDPGCSIWHSVMRMGRATAPHPQPGGPPLKLSLMNGLCVSQGSPERQPKAMCVRGRGQGADGLAGRLRNGHTPVAESPPPLGVFCLSLKAFNWSEETHHMVEEPTLLKTHRFTRHLLLKQHLTWCWPRASVLWPGHSTRRPTVTGCRRGVCTEATPLPTPLPTSTLGVHRRQEKAPEDLGEAQPQHPWTCPLWTSFAGGRHELESRGGGCCFRSWRSTEQVLCSGFLVLPPFPSRCVQSGSERMAGHSGKNGSWAALCDLPDSC